VFLNTVGVPALEVKNIKQPTEARGLRVKWKEERDVWREGGNKGSFAFLALHLGHEPFISVNMYLCFDEPCKWSNVLCYLGGGPPWL
jgi:hypothetical protein